MLDIAKDIQSLSHFKRHTALVMRQIKESGLPVVLTINGKAEVVVQDAEAYQRLLDLAAAADAAEGIRQGLADLGNDRTGEARAIFDEIRAENSIPR